MAAEYGTGQRNSSNTQILEELEALSQSLYHSHLTSTSPATRRTASLALPRTSVPPISSSANENLINNDDKQLNPKPRSRRMSLSPWRSRPKFDSTQPEDEERIPRKDHFNKSNMEGETTTSSEKKGIWSWKPIRALSRIGMQKLSCLFSVEVVTVQGLPASMNGLRLSVCVRKKETKDGAVQTMPSRVQQGAADFEETLFIRCHVYYTPGNASGTPMKFEPRPFLIYVFAVDAGELDFGRSAVDLSHMIQESIDKSFEGTRVRQWDTSFNLSGKAKGGELVLKLGFQIMEKDGGIGIYSQAGGQKSAKNRDFSSSLARKQSKSSFSVPSPKLSSRAEAWTPSQAGGKVDLQDIDDLNLDDEPPPPPLQKSQVPDTKLEDDLPEFDVVDKGVEIQEKDGTEQEEEEEEAAASEENSEKKSVSGEVVKEIVHEQVHLTRLTELDSIAQQIKALESMMTEEKPERNDEETELQKLDAEEETVTREFLQLLEDSESNEFKLNHHEVPQLKLEGDENSREAEANDYIPDLGKGLGGVVQTRNGGFLAAMNPLDNAIARKDTPKLAMQISKPAVLQSKATNGFELFQRMAALGLEELGSEILSLMPMEELKGKTAEQIAFEGIASAIIQGRNKEGASSSAARTIASVKSMVIAMSTGRKDRISTGIWNLTEDPLPVDDILAFSMQKLEVMAVEALKIQTDTAEEEAPFDVSPLNARLTTDNHPLASAIPLEEWMSNQSLRGSSYEGADSAGITISVVVQLRDPLRQYEAVGGPMIALIHANCVDVKSGKYEEEKMFKVASLHVGGFKARDGEKKTVWDSQKQRLTAMQWLVACGLGKAGKRGKRQVSKGQDFLWSISSRVMADMWLKAIRNPDVKFIK